MRDELAARVINDCRLTARRDTIKRLAQHGRFATARGADHREMPSLNGSGHGNAPDHDWALARIGTGQRA